MKNVLASIMLGEEEDIGAVEAIGSLSLGQLV